MSRRKNLVRSLGLASHVETVRKRVEREHDEQIVAAILAQATEKDRARVVRGQFQRLYPFALKDGVSNVIRCCAVGAGLLYRGITIGDMTGDALEAFAALYNVPYNCAEGISDGFEGSIGTTNGQDSWIDRVDDGEIDEQDSDYVRGWAIGAAIADILGVST